MMPIVSWAVSSTVRSTWEIQREELTPADRSFPGLNRLFLQLVIHPSVQPSFDGYLAFVTDSINYLLTLVLQALCEVIQALTYTPH